MARIEKTVFISYRRTNAAWTLAIYQYLTRYGYDVFYDIAGLGPGDFETVIVENIRARAHFVIVLTPSALERCREPEDWLRREIELALDSRRNIVALMLDEFKFNSPGVSEQLTGKLAALKKYTAVHVPADYFEAAMERLRNQFLSVPVDAVAHPASAGVQRAAEEQQAQANAAEPVSQKELTAEQWFERAVQSTDQDEQIRLYTHAIELKPDFPEAFNNRGYARDDGGDYEGAIRDYDEAIRLRPDDAEAFNNRGVARKHKGDIDGAIRDYDEAIRLVPNYRSAFKNRGRTRYAKNDIAGSILDFDEAIRLGPTDADAYYNRGILLFAKRDLDGAIRDYDEALRLQPDYADAFTNRGVARKKKGDIDGAIRDYDEAIRLRPEDPDVFYNRGLARKAKGDTEGAERDFAEARRLGWKES
jgi:tetratricopeptide (TPR) repeat protein